MIAGQRKLASHRAGLLDWLAESTEGDNVSTGVNIIQGNYECVHCKIHFSSFVAIMC